jgi:hypothetical protein
LRKSFQQIIAEYGPVAVVVYFTLFFGVLGGAWLAIHLGWQPGSMAGNVGVFTGAYLFTKVTQPLRIAATLAITPFAARLYHRFRPAGATPPPVAAALVREDEAQDPAVG